MPAPLIIDAPTVASLVTWSGAITALRAALADGLDPQTQPARTSISSTNGELLLMPAEFDNVTGVKVLSIAPGNPALGQPTIQATFILMDTETLTPRAVMDGTALTTLRTPSLSAVAVDEFARLDARRLVVFGAGAQAEGHVHALLAIRRLDDIRIVSRSTTTADKLVLRLKTHGIDASVGTKRDVKNADIVVTATNAREALFDGATVRDTAMIAAIGSHHPDRRELDSALLHRALVIVEDVATALREAGDIVLAVQEGALRVGDITPLGDYLKRGPQASREHQQSGPVVFKTVGQGWEDLVIAKAVYQAAMR